MRVGIVAGESSGDILGAGLMRAIRARIPSVEFEGVAGPLMLAAGCRALYPAETLAVMGITEVLQHLPRILAVRRHLRKHFLANPPDIFIGIDSPDFNIGLEASLHRSGIRTVHYVSPSVWAWRPSRVFKVGRAVDLVLTLLPFEPAFYAKHGFRAEFVGHPLADAIPENIDRAVMRRSLQVRSGPLAALLPGSRFGEVKRLGPLFLETAQWLVAHRPDLQFVIPAATPGLKSLIEAQIAASQPGLPVTVLTGRSREVLQAADAALLASGTASLEAMLCACPMVVAYRLSPMSYALIGASILSRIQHVALPNLLAGQVVVPEFMQDRVVPADMGAALLSLLEAPQARDTQLRKFQALAGVLRRGADGRAAEAVLQLLNARSAVER